MSFENYLVDTAAFNPLLYIQGLAAAIPDGWGGRCLKGYTFGRWPVWAALSASGPIQEKG
jgi:hypothetical protein